jgi:uncharacterized protein YutE (UPF0331/DUF86 family)
MKRTELLALRAEIEALEPYLGFRHFFRHSYTFEIDWEKLRPLVDQVEGVFEKFRQDVEAFLAAQRPRRRKQT